MTDHKPTLTQRFQGCLLGLATGDAVGTTLEFKQRGSFTPITDMVGGGPFRLKAGQWTDDTSMALCLAHSLVFNRGFNAEDQMHRYCNWRKLGYMSSTGVFFDIGITTSSALNKFEKSKNPFSGSVDPHTAGNGSLMRLAPIPLFYHNNFTKMIEFAGESSRTTHGAAECIDACKYFSSLIFAALSGKDKDSILSSTSYTPETENVKTIATGKYRYKTSNDIQGTGYVIDALEAALWCFATTSSFADAILTAANLGDDADTTAAICGQIAGAFYGKECIPQKWLDKLYDGDAIAELAVQLMQ